MTIPTPLHTLFCLSVFLYTLSVPEIIKAQPPQQLRQSVNKELTARGLSQKPAASVVATIDKVTLHENVTYADLGDRKLRMDIYQPRQSGLKPAILVVHGGGWFKGNKEKFRPLARYLAQYGFVTAAIEYRLAGEAYFPAAVQDCNTATRFLRKHAAKYDIDPKRIGAIGGSAGGHLVGLMATSNGNPELLGTIYADYSSTIQSAVVLAGPLDLITGPVAERSRQTPDESNSNRWLGKTLDDAPELHKLASPLYRINKSTPPIHFLLGEHDSPQRNLPARKLLHDMETRSQLHVYRFGMHGCWNQAPWIRPLADDAARLFAHDLESTLLLRNLQHGDSLTNITNHHSHLLLSDLAIDNGKISVPRYHSRIGLTYVKGDPEKKPLRVVPEIEYWDIHLPADIAPDAEIFMELLDPPVLGALPSVVAQQGASPIHLNAHFAETYGEKLRFEPQPHKNTIGYWVNPEDWCRWRIYVETPGTYELTIHQGCGKGHGGSLVAIKSNEQTIEFTVEDTGHFQNFKPRMIGKFKFDAPGAYNVDIRPIRKAKVAIMDVRLMELTLSE